MAETHRDTGAGPEQPSGPPGPDAELIRLGTEAAFHQRLRDLTVAFSRDVSSTATVGPALDAFAIEVNGLLGATATSVWLHQRRVHRLALASSSDGRHRRMAVSVPSTDLSAPPALGLRLDGPALLPDAVTAIAPLRGWRRALGTLVVEGPFSTSRPRDQIVPLLQEVARQLSAAVEHIQLLEEIVRQQRLLENTFDALVDLVVVTDAACRVVQMNEAFRARVGLSRAELLGRALDRLVGPELAAWVAARADDSGESPDEPVPEARRLEDGRLGGTFAVTMTRLAAQMGEAPGRVLVIRDITEQTRLEREREALQQRLVHSEKLASLGQFVAGVAHEMNNPLQGVLGHLELLMATSDAARPIKRELRRIYQEADRAAKIVRNLLVFTGSRRMVRKRLRLPRILSRALASRATPLKKARIEVRRHDADAIPWIAGDPLLLHQAFVNILVNAEHAIAAAAASGRVDIHTRWDPATRRVIAEIHDSGHGLPPDILPRIFDPFFTTKEAGRGTGLGLAITYGIIKEHGGTIEALNAAGGGAVFRVELPGEVG